MSPKNKDSRALESQTNARLRSSIVHKPFATGTINIFNPHRSKGKQDKKADSRLATPKLYLNAKLESNDLETSEVAEKFAEIGDREPNSIDRWLNPWSVSAIAIIIFANLVSGAVIWRNYRLTDKIDLDPEVATLGSANLADEEFMPLNLSTLSRLKTVQDTEQSSIIEPISPALAPIDLGQSTSNPAYHYVLTEYKGDKSLTLAREKATQVSLVNLPQGIFIYLGAYKERDLADAFVAHLKENDLAAQVYPLQ